MTTKSAFLSIKFYSLRYSNEDPSPAILTLVQVIVTC